MLRLIQTVLTTTGLECNTEITSSKLAIKRCNVDNYCASIVFDDNCGLLTQEKRAVNVLIDLPALHNNTFMTIVERIA